MHSCTRLHAPAHTLRHTAAAHTLPHTPAHAHTHTHTSACTHHGMPPKVGPQPCVSGCGAVHLGAQRISLRALRPNRPPLLTTIGSMGAWDAYPRHIPTLTRTHTHPPTRTLTHTLTRTHAPASLAQSAASSQATDHATSWPFCIAASASLGFPRGLPCCGLTRPATRHLSCLPHLPACLPACLCSEVEVRRRLLDKRVMLMQLGLDEDEIKQVGRS
jgi:hypothetical protein